MHRGELFVCGRLKDLLIVRGRNHYPQDIERTAERAAADALRPGSIAAFTSAAANGEALVLIAEARPELASEPARGAPGASALARATDAVRTAIAHEHGIAASHVRLLRPRTVPKTTSGKIARQRCRRAFEQGTLEILHAWDEGRPRAGAGPAGGDPARPPMDPAAVRAMPERELLARMRADFARLANVDVAHLDDDCPLIELGVDSLAIAELATLLQQEYACEVPDEFLFAETTTLLVLARAAKRGGVSDDDLREAMGEDGDSAG